MSRLMNSPKSDRGDVSRLRLSFSSRRSSPGRRSSPSRRRASPREKKEEVKVVVRLRPPMEQMNQLAYFVEADPTKLLGYSQEESGRSSPSRACVEELQFSRVVGPEEDTLQMYSVLGLKGLIGGITDGFQETVFAYGQTGSGKTHTILGSPQELGLLQLCAKELFAAVFATGAEEKHRRVQLVCLEIKNDEVLNLLPEGNATASQEADIFCHKGRRYGYQRVTVWSYEETMVLLQQAIASREVGSSYVNSESSRSHMLVRFLVKTLRAEHGQLAEGVVGSLTLVDLAGNERESGTNGTAINVSLTHLNRMLVKMQDRQLDESDRRQSALNMVLYEGLKEDCGVTMVFCIHPERRFAAAARATLQMATLCRRIIQRKRVRYLEGSSLKEELAGLRSVMQEHQQAHAAQLAKEEELQRAREVLRSLKMRYDEKSRDYEALKKNLEAEFQRVSLEGREKAELKHRNEELVKRVEELQRMVARQGDELPMTVLASQGASESFEDHCQELQRAYHHELQSVHQAYKKQLKTLHEAMKLRPSTPVLDKDGTRHSLESKENGGSSAEARAPSWSSWAFADLGVQSSTGTGTSAEPCSEPSMYSGEDNHAELEAPSKSADEGQTRPAQMLSPARLLKVASPQRNGAWALSESQDRSLTKQTSDGCFITTLDTPSIVHKVSSHPMLSPYRVQGTSTTTLGSPAHERVKSSSEGRANQRARCEYGKAPLFSPPARGRSVKESRAGSDAAEALQMLLAAQPQTLAEVEAIEDAASTLARLALHGRLPKSLWLQACAAGVRVMHILPQSAQAQRDGAILLSELASKDAASKEDVAARGGVLLAVSALRWLATTSALQNSQSLLHHMSPQCSEACSGAFRLLAVMCRNTGRQAQATEVGSLQVCLQCMSQPLLRGHDTAIHGCWLLMALCHKHPGNQEMVRQKGGVALVVQLLEEQVRALEANRPAGSAWNLAAAVDPRAANLCAYAAGFLASVAEGHEGCRKVLYEGGGVGILMRALEMCMQSPHVVANTCIAVAHLAYLHEPSQRAARAQGGIMSMLRALLTFRGDGPVQGSICRAVAVLTEGPCKATQQAFLAARVQEGDKETGAVTLLIQALRDLPQDAALVTTACWALANLVSDSPEAIDHLCTIGGAATAVMLLKGPVACQEHACEYLCRFIASIAGGSSWRSRQLLLASGALEALRLVQQQHAHSSGEALPSIFRALRAFEVQ